MSSKALPGEELIEKGLRDLRDGEITKESLLVMIGASRLRAVGLEVPEPLVEEPEHELYRLLSGSGEDAHSRYNALIRQLVSYSRAAECAIP